MLESELGELTIEQYRRFYAEEIQAVAHLVSPGLVRAFSTVPRENFLGPAPWEILGDIFLKTSNYRPTSELRDVYHNVVVALKSGENLNNGQPGSLATWIAALNLASDHRVLHVGCGTGYYSAIMAEMVGPGGTVIAAEIDPDLALRAKENLKTYSNVAVYSADGGSVDAGLCDAILVNAGVTHPHIPWLSSLKHGGTLVLPLTVPMTPNLGRGLMVGVTRHGARFKAKAVSMVAIYSSASVRDPGCETQLNRALESQDLLKLRSIRLDAHEQDDTCIVHAPAVCVSAADSGAG